MGPLVPEIFNDQFNFVIALVIGFFFGFVLEQAGFSSSKKLAGLFYGYDFVVLKVFFTAGITAMIGITLFGYLGWLDLGVIFVNPTFLWSAIIGGAIMGLGFIIGGFCPGTSVAAAAIGKIDAIVFIVGSLFGILFFAEIYPSVEYIYNGWNYGEWRIDEALGLSRGLFIFFMVVVATAAFYFTSLIENRINKVPAQADVSFFKQAHNRFLPYAGIFIVAGIVLIFLPSRENSILSSLNKEIISDQNKIHYIEPIELAYRIIDEDENLLIVDLRNKVDSSKTTMPGAVNYKFDELFQQVATNFIKNTYKTIVFVDDDGSNSQKAVLYALRHSNYNTLALRGGINAFDKTFNVPAKSDLAGFLNISANAENDFIKSVPEKFKLLREKFALLSAPPQAKARKSTGGC